MPSGFIWLVPSVTALCLVAGCSSPPRGSAAGPKSNPPAVRIESPEQLERRAEAHARFLTGLSLDQNDESRLALEEYNKSLEADPANEMLAMDLSRRLVQMKEPEQAIAVLKKLADRSSTSAPIHARLAVLHLQAGQTNEAVEAARTAIKREPRSMVGYQSLYGIYRQNGQTNEAQRVLSQAWGQKNPDAPFLVDLAALYLIDDGRRGQVTNTLGAVRAREALQRAVQMAPTNLFVLQKLAQSLRMVGEDQQAAEIYLKMLQEVPELPSLRQELAEIYLRSNDHKRAAEQLEALSQDNPTNPQAHYLLGALAYEDKRYSEAVEHYRRALLLNPNSEQLYYDIAAAKLALNDAREALDYLQEAKRRFRQSFVAEFFSGIAYMRLKEYTNALDRFNAAEIVASATETNRLTHTFYFQLGSAHERAGRIDEAVNYFEKSIAISPDFSEALNYLGYMWAERGTNLDRARKLIEHAVKLDPTNAAFLDSLGWVLFKQGQVEEALPYIEQAVSLSSEPDATLYDHLGDIFAALKKTDQARDAWRKSLEIEPNEIIERKLNGGAAQTAKPES